MIKETIPSELLMIGLSISDNVLNFCVVKGIEKGFTPLAPITIMVDGKRISYQDAKNTIVGKDLEITLIQFEK